MTAYLKGTRHFMKNPENLLSMLENLIGNNEIGLAIRKRQAVALNVEHVNLVGFPCQSMSVCRSTFHSYKSGLRMKSSDNFEIPSRSGPQIDHDFEVREVANKLLYNERTISLPLVREPG
jgi:hypothetical protein